MENLTVEKLESLKTKYQQAITWSDEEGYITPNSDDIINFIEEKIKEIAKTENCLLEIEKHCYPVCFSDNDEFIDLQVQVYSNINYEEEVIKMFEAHGLYVTYFYFDEENNRSGFTVYTSITVEEE